MYKKVEISNVVTSELPKVDKTKEGENELKDEFIRSNLRLVLSVVRKFSAKDNNIDDIFQIGCVGLIKAVDNFDFSYNVKFSTYAVPTDTDC